MAAPHNLIVALALVCAPLDARAEDKPKAWIVMPVWGPTAPPLDPTFGRITSELEAVIERAAGDAPVTVVTPEKRQELCNERGHNCPIEIASLIEAHKVIELELNDKLDKLTMRVWGRPRGLLRQIDVPCTWLDGRPSCPTDAIEKGLKGDDLAELDPKRVEEALRALEPKIVRCKEKKSHKPKATHEVDVVLSLRVSPNGRVREVRVDPKELQNLPSWACIARTVEALRVPPFRADQPVPMRFPIGKGLVVTPPTN